MPVTLKQEVVVTESLDTNEVMVTEPIVVVKPPEIIKVPVANDNTMAEAITIVLVCLLAYGVFRLVLFLIPYLIMAGIACGVIFLGYRLL